jgi:hypothetical protein
MLDLAKTFSHNKISILIIKPHYSFSHFLFELIVIL